MVVTTKVTINCKWDGRLFDEDFEWRINHE